MLDVARFAFALRLGDGTDPAEPLLSALTEPFGRLLKHCRRACG